jgi:hypothetical protein
LKVDAEIAVPEKVRGDKDNINSDAANAGDALRLREMGQRVPYDIQSEEV